MRRLLIALSLLLPATAAADGGPVVPAMDGHGVARGTTRFIAAHAGRNTLMERLGPDGVQRTRLIHGGYGVPQAAYDGTATGLSADGRRLVVQQMIGRHYPPHRTRLIVLDRNLKARDRIDLPGFSTVDAISPDARWLYLLHYRGLRYSVRAYDLAHHRLLRKPVIDPREPDEQMQGLPITRVSSPDGRWQYTLYQGGGGDAPFIHALDTAGRTARCIDLDDLAGANPAILGLRLTAGGLEVRNGAQPLLVSTTAWTVATTTRVLGLRVAVPV